MYEESIVKKIDKNILDLHLYQKIFTHSKDAIAIFEPHGCYIEQNPSHRALFGYSDEDLIGKTPAIHLGEDVFSNVLRTLSQENIYRGDMISYTKEGREIHVNLSAFSVKDEEGNVRCYVGINSFIPENRQPCDKHTEECGISSSLLQIFETMHSSLDEKQILSDVMKIIPAHLKFSRAAILMYDHDRSAYVSVSSYGYSPPEESIHLSKSFSEHQIPALKEMAKGESLWINRTEDHADLSREFVDAFNIKNAILLPIVVGRKVRGILVGDCGKDSPTELRDASTLKVIADSLGIAVHKCRLYKESTERLIDLNNRVETIKMRSHIDREILSALDRDTVLNAAIAMIGRVIPCDRVAVLLKEQRIYRVIAEWGEGYLKKMAFELSGHQIDVIEHFHSPIFIADLSQDRDNSSYYQSLMECGILSSIIVPLVIKGATIGFVNIGSKTPAKLSSTHLATAEGIAAQIAVAFDHASLYEDLQKAIINTITSFASIIDAKSPWTRGHSERVTQYAVATGIELGLDLASLEMLRLAGVLHDIGKIGTYDLVLDKPSSLTTEEFDLIKKHPSRGAAMLKPIKQLKDILPIIRHHHEWMDGTGHPDGLKGEDIPLGARILAVTDAYDSMTADRPYRKAPGKQFAFDELKRCSGTQFDPQVVEAFLKVMEGQNSSKYMTPEKSRANLS